MPVITCSQRTAKASQSQMMAYSYMPAAPLSLDRASSGRKRVARKCLQIAEHFQDSPENASVAAHVLRRQPQDVRPGLRARLDVGGGARPADVGGGRLSARIAELERHLGVRLFNRTTRSRCSRPSRAAIFYKGALQDPRDDRRGRGGGRRRVAEAAGLAPRRGAARHRQAADRAADPGLQGPLSARSTCGCGCPTGGST